MKTAAKQLKEYIHASGWHQTPARKLASERNWCRFMLAGMEGLTNFMANRQWLSEPVAQQLRRAITSARWSVEVAWDDKYNQTIAKGRDYK